MTLKILEGIWNVVDEVQALIEETWPWFDWESPIAKQHRSRLEEVKRFYSKHQEEPRNGGSRWNGTEDQLACYIGNRRKEKKNNKLDAQAQIWIEEEWPWFDWQSQGSKAAKSIAEETSLANTFGGILFSHRRDNVSGTN